MLRFTQIEERDIPRPHRYNKLRVQFEEFLSMNVKVAKIEYGNDYKSSAIAANTFRVSIKRFGFPINVIRRKDEVFFVRRDL